MDAERIVHGVADRVRDAVTEAEKHATGVARLLDGLRGAGGEGPEIEPEPVRVPEPEPGGVPEPTPTPAPEPEPPPDEATPPSPDEPMGGERRRTTEELIEQLRSGSGG